MPKAAQPTRRKAPANGRKTRTAKPAPPKIEAAPDFPVIIPAPVGTFVIHAVKTSATTIELLVHVCTHFERFGDRIVPRSLVAPDPKAIAAAVMHPTQHISSPQAGLTFANAEEYRSYIAQRFLPGEKQTEPTPPKARRKPVQEEEDLVG